MARPVNRVQPVMPVQAYKTFRIAQPAATHWRPATCREVDCAQWERGWVTRIDTASDLGARQANYIRMHSGRAFTAAPIAPGASIVEFTFPAGQKCFRQHHVPLERPAFYIVRGGDWRGSTGVIRRHHNGDDWVDDFATHQDRLATRLERG